jgi:hypothetical protein
VNRERGEEWVRVDEALRHVDAYEREGRAIDGLEAARITDNEKLPALADFKGCTAPESWAFAERLPAEATHVSFFQE